MARYATRLYDTFLYGQGFVAGLTVEPFEALAVDYNQVVLRYVQPSGDIYRFRIVRSQEGIPETAEDGIVIVDEAYENPPFAAEKSIIDGDGFVGNFISFTQGQYVYYAAWALIDDGWFLCGVTSTVMVKQHREVLEDGTQLADTHTKVLSLLPRLYTSPVFDPLDEIDYDSDLARFLFGFSYSLDEMLTYIDLLVPDYTQRNLSIDRLNFKSRELGIAPENRPSTKQQKRLVRDAIELYSQKGTVRSLRKFVQDITGYEAEVGVSPNLLLSTQDSTFRGSVGAWKTYGDCTLETSRNVVPPIEENAVDLRFSGKVIINDEYSRIANGLTKPLLYGIPVSEGETYTFSFYHSYLNQDPGVSVTAGVQWFDYRGNKISQERQDTPEASTDGWQQDVFTVTAPAGAIRAAIEVLFTGTGTVYVDMFQFALGEVTEYYEPRQAVITLFPSKKNLLTNPSFENFDEGEGLLSFEGDSLLSFEGEPEFPGWSITADSFSQKAFDEENPAPLGVFTPGAFYAEIITSDNGTTEISTAIEPREFECYWYTFTIYAKSADDMIPLTLRLTIEDTQEGATLPNSIKEEQILVTNEWQRFSVTACVSGMFIDEKVTATIVGDTLGQTLHLDMAQIEPTFGFTDYFDGTHVALGARWGAQPQNSESYLYENIVDKRTRLRNEIENFLPLNTPYVVKTLTATEFSGVS